MSKLGAEEVKRFHWSSQGVSQKRSGEKPNRAILVGGVL